MVARIIALTGQLLPVLATALLVWLCIVWYFDLFDSIRENIFISLTMFFGAFIAGGTAEGGGAIAFPVMTLLYDFSPSTSAQFALAIQSFGMTSASYLIIRRKIKVAQNVINLALPFACAGFLFGKFFIAPYIPTKFAKLFFVSFWLSFGIVLYLKNRKKASTRQAISLMAIKSRAFIIIAGLLGGCLSATFGSGVDIVCFSLTTIYFGLCEKVATPTSVILMAGVSLFGTVVNVATTGLDSEVLPLLAAAIPIVVIMAPLGACFVSTRSREFITHLLYLILTVQYVGALLILKVNNAMLAFSITVVIAGVYFYHRLQMTNDSLDYRPSVK